MAQAKRRSRKQARIRVKQYRSAIGASPYQRAVLRGLGVTMRRARDLEDTPAIRGMVAKIPHLARIETPTD